jgi:RNA polymerase sigma-70 factor (ECF subfamily)
VKELRDDELVRRAAGEDRKAFAELIDRHKEGVFALLYRLLGRSEEVEDVAQNVFLAAYRGLPAFKGHAKFGTWIFRIAYNQAVTALRRTITRRSRELPEPRRNDDDSAPMEWRDTAGPSPEEGALANQVWRAVGRLPTQLRAVVELHHGRGLSYPEIAEVLELPLGTVKTHLHRARALLRGMLIGGEAPPAGSTDE